jgi:hypothetical protein
MRVLVDRRMGIVPEEVRLFMLAWARFDAPGAYAWASEGPAGWQETLTDQAIYAWAYYDGPAAMSAAEETEGPKRIEALKQQALNGWMRSDDKHGVTDYIANYPDGKRRGRLYFLLGGEVAMREGNDAAMRWVEALPDDSPNNLKRGVFGVVAKIVAGDDPLRAADWFVAHRTRPYSGKALDGIMRRWVQNQDPLAAFEWLLALSSDGLRAQDRGNAIKAGFRKWIQLDREAAQSWLLSALPNPALDPAVLEALKILLQKDPGAAIAWAQRLDDEALRHSESVRVGIRWRGKDSEAFDDWLKENELPEETRQKILAAPLPQKRAARMRAGPMPQQPGVQMTVEVEAQPQQPGARMKAEPNLPAVGKP